MGHERPTLVGGAAVELYSSSAINTGDFDIVTGVQDIFGGILVEQGFVRPSGLGMAMRGWIHPDFKLGFEVVSSTLLDGMAERDRVRQFSLDADGIVAVLSLEDMIADRVGQFASGAAPEMLGQARALFHLFSDVDLEYLERRVRYESGGDYGLEVLKA